MQELLAQLQLANLRNYTASRISAAMAKGAATSALRTIDPRLPASWEFSAFSQNGEDGIIDYLTRRLVNPNHYFIEIGASDGLENNSSWLAIARRFEGVMIDGDEHSVWMLQNFIFPMAPCVLPLQMFIKKESVEDLKRIARHPDPDVFSLDIDGNDYYIAKEALERGFRPKIVVVEYNSAFGPDQSKTIVYDESFVVDQHNDRYLYFGVSIAAWRKLFDAHGYRFVTVERRGVNAFFADPDAFEPGFLDAVAGRPFAENTYQSLRYGMNWEGQWKTIEARDFYEP